VRRAKTSFWVREDLEGADLDLGVSVERVPWPSFDDSFLEYSETLGGVVNSE
jgi:hypothetical protein